MALELTVEDRRRRVMDMLSEQGFMTLADLAQRFGVSESTLRRDLEVLDEQSVVKRTRGGAVYVKDTSPQPLGFAEREATALAEKAAIARAVAGLVEPEQTLIVNGGTTCFHVARELAGRRLSVVTNSVPIAAVLMGEPQTEVTLLGGYLYPRTGVTVGASAQEMLAGLHADLLVFSCAGVAEGSGYNANQMMVEVEQRMLQTAGRAILAIDHNKIGRKALVRLCDLKDIDIVVTDDGATEDQLAMLRAGGAREVIVAGREMAR